MSTSPARDDTDTVDDRPTPASNSFVGDVLVNTERWACKAVQTPAQLVLEVALAIFSLLMFTAVFGDLGALALERGAFAGVDYVTFILPAALVQVAGSAAIGSGIGLIEDLDSGMFEKTLVSPMHPAAVFLGKAIAELARVVCYVLLIVGLGMAMGASVETGLLGIAGIVLVCLLFALWYMAISNVVALLSGDEGTLDAAANLLLFPLLFFSSAFLPLSALPQTVQDFATVNPVTYGADAVRALVLGRDVSTVVQFHHFGGALDTLVPAVAVLVALDGLFGGIAVWLLARASRSTMV